MAHQQFELAMALPPLRSVIRPDLHLRSLKETHSEPELVLSVQANPETPLAILRVLREKRLAQESQLLLREKDSKRPVLLLAAQTKRRD